MNPPIPTYPEPIDPKFCKDCDHYLRPHNPFERGCWHPANMKTDVISGVKFPESNARGMRLPMGACGPAGELFEPKRPRPGLFRRLFPI